MTCGATMTDAPAPAVSAGRLHLTIPARSDRSAPAATTASGRKRAGRKSTTPDLTARAVRLNNRSKAGADRYLALHATLSSKR